MAMISAWAVGSLSRSTRLAAAAITVPSLSVTTAATGTSPDRRLRQRVQEPRACASRKPDDVLFADMTKTIAYFANLRYGRSSFACPIKHRLRELMTKSPARQDTPAQLIWQNFFQAEIQHRNDWPNALPVPVSVPAGMPKNGLKPDV